MYYRGIIQIQTQVNKLTSRESEIKELIDILKKLYNVIIALDRLGYKSIIDVLEPIPYENPGETLRINIVKIINSTVKETFGVDYDITQCPDKSDIESLSRNLDTVSFILQNIRKIKEVNPLIIRIIADLNVCVLMELDEELLDEILNLTNDVNILLEKMSKIFPNNKTGISRSVKKYIHMHLQPSSLHYMIEGIASLIGKIHNNVDNLLTDYRVLTRISLDESSARTSTLIIGLSLKKLQDNVISLKSEIERIVKDARDYIDALSVMSNTINKTRQSLKSYLSALSSRLDKVINGIASLIGSTEALTYLKRANNRIRSLDPISNYYEIVDYLLRIDEELSTRFDTVLSPEEKKLYEEIQNFFMNKKKDEVGLQELYELISKDLDSFRSLCDKGLIQCIIRG